MIGLLDAGLHVNLGTLLVILVVLGIVYLVLRILGRV